MSKNTLVALVALSVIFGCLTWLYFTQFGRMPQTLLKPDQALGDVVAEETAKLLGKRGQVVVVRELADRKSLALDTQVDFFKKGLKKMPGITLGGVELVKMGRLPMSPEKRMIDPFAEPSMGLLPSQLVNIVQSHPKADAFVIFGGFPPLTAEEFNGLKQGGSKWIVVSDYEPHYKGLMQAQIIGLAIVPRLGSSQKSGEEPKTSREWFDREYIVVTPESQ
ncbi:MAG: hypothetical protein HY232_13595 [Acidobacteria bacterium]|nr:hypothetical protein [Acidobacteriota bacterium]